MAHVADYTGDRLRLPPVIDVFPTRELNRAAYLWLAALAAAVRLPEPQDDPLLADVAELAALASASRTALAWCPGLRPAHAAMVGHVRALRRRRALPAVEAGVEGVVLALLGDLAPAVVPTGTAPRGYRTYAPVPILLRLARAGAGRTPRLTPTTRQSRACRRAPARRPGVRIRTRRAARTASSFTASRRSCPGPRA